MGAVVERCLMFAIMKLVFLASQRGFSTTADVVLLYCFCFCGKSAEHLTYYLQHKRPCCIPE